MFREIYYWIFIFQSSIKTNKTPAFNSYVLICILQAFNIGTFYIISAYLLKISISIDWGLVNYLGIGLALLLYIINYFLLYAKREEIFEQYQKLTKGRRITGKIYSFLYIVLSFVALFVTGIYLAIQGMD